MGNDCTPHCVGEQNCCRSSEIELDSEHAPAHLSARSSATSDNVDGYPRLALGQQSKSPSDGIQKDNQGSDQALQIGVGAVIARERPTRSTKADAKSVPKSMPDSISSVAASSVDGDASGDSPSLALVFEVDGKSRSVLMERRPLGAEIGETKNGITQITKVHPKSYALELGITPGWILKAIGSQDVSNKASEETLDALKNASAGQTAKM
jgi:hypothetical protein